MISKSIVYIFLFWLLVNQTMSQEWIRIYGDTVNTVANNVFEHYDKGYMFSGERYNPGWTVYGWVLKTDINGYQNWTKSFGNSSMIIRFFGSAKTSCGGFIAIGLSNKLYQNCSDPLIIKLNACGEKEWCKIYDSQSCNSTGYDVVIVPGGGYMALIDHWTTNQRKLIWLFRLDSIGEVIWSQAYATDSIFAGEWSHSLLMTTDTNFVITGETYYPDSTFPPGYYVKKILLIKVNLDGIAQFQIPWGSSNGVICDGRLSTKDVNNNIYTSGRRARTTAPSGDSPCLFKTSSDGNPIYYSDLRPSSYLGISSTINWFQDSTLVLCAGWAFSNGIDTTAVIKTSASGIVMKLKPLLINTNTSLYGSDITYNNRLILAGSVSNSNNLLAYAFKLNSNLDYDSIYTHPFTYDSLCPHLIVSDTTSLDDCQVVYVGIDDPIKNPEKTKLHVYPNPAKNTLTIEMPLYLTKQSKGYGLTATTIYHQWKSATLEIYDLFGKLMFSGEIPQKTDKIELDISGWHEGMYVTRVVYMNDIVASAKFVVE